jgi:hypothetical protein
MRKSWLLCVLLGTLSWGQAAPGTPPPAQPAQAPPAVVKPPAQAAPSAVKPSAPASQTDTSATVPDDAAVITVEGVCAPQPKPAAAKGTAAKPPAAKTPADCKTVVTKKEFELLLKGIPNANPAQIPQLRRNIANVLPRLIAMSNQAEKQGMDKTPEFKEQLKIHRMQILATELQQKMQEDAANVPEQDISDYYKRNPEAFEQYNLERLIVPRTKQIEAELKDEKEEEKNEKPTEEQLKARQAEQKAKQEEAEQAMTKLAETLRARAAAGEDFATLQKEAYEAADLKIAAPNVILSNVRRNGALASQPAVFDLKPGEVSQVINDAGGHYIYKMKSEEELSFEQVKDEIHGTLQRERQRDMMEKVNNSFHAVTNDAYFGPGGVATPPQPRMPNPRMVPPPHVPATQPQTPPPAQAPPPAAPQAQPQTPPPAQPPAQPPAEKPN